MSCCIAAGTRGVALNAPQARKAGCTHTLKRGRRKGGWAKQSGTALLLVHPGLGGERVVDNVLAEPQLNLLLGALDRVRAVADVAANLDAKVAADGAGERVVGAGLAEELAARADGVVALPHHADDGARGHVLDEASEEALGGQVGVVLLKELLGGVGHLQGSELEALLLKALDDLADQATLDAVGLDHNVGALASHVEREVGWQKGLGREGIKSECGRCGNSH